MKGAAGRGGRTALIAKWCWSNPPLNDEVDRGVDVPSECNRELPEPAAAVVARRILPHRNVRKTYTGSMVKDDMEQ